jgi:hypothetical protein
MQIQRFGQVDSSVREWQGQACVSRRERWISIKESEIQAHSNYLSAYV